MYVYNLLCVVFLNQSTSKQRTSLLAMAVGLKQKRYVDEIVKKVYSQSCFGSPSSWSLYVPLFFCIQNLRDHVLWLGLIVVSSRRICCDAFSLRRCCWWVAWHGMEWRSHSCLGHKPNKMVWTMKYLFSYLRFYFSWMCSFSCVRNFL